MRFVKNLMLAVAVALVALPIGASIKAMTLSELMSVTDDVVHVRILEKTTFHLAYPSPDSVYTKLEVKGVSLRTGEAVETEVVFLGSHDPADEYGITIMPTLQDTRVGHEAIIFLRRDAQMPGQMLVVDNLGCLYRLEQGFGPPVVMGKGEGAAFPENVKLEDARRIVHETHLLLQAAKASAEK